MFLMIYRSFEKLLMMFWEIWRSHSVLVVTYDLKNRPICISNVSCLLWKEGDILNRRPYIQLNHLFKVFAPRRWSELQQLMVYIHVCNLRFAERNPHVHISIHKASVVLRIWKSFLWMQYHINFTEMLNLLGINNRNFRMFNKMAF